MTLLEPTPFETMASDKEEDLVCDECGCDLDEMEIDDFYIVPMCQDCTKTCRVSQVRQELPAHFDIKEVRGKHAKPCSGCSKTDWGWGDYYVHDLNSHWGTSEKYCLECAELKDWNSEIDGGVIGCVHVPVIHVPPPPAFQNACSKRQCTIG